MTTDTSRSEQVVDDYKKHKLARSALRKIHDLILGYEQDRLADARLARIGIVILLVLIATAVYFFFATESVTLS